MLESLLDGEPKLAMWLIKIYPSHFIDLYKVRLVLTFFGGGKETYFLKIWKKYAFCCFQLYYFEVILI